MTTVALFDLDETLVFGDTAEQWGHFSLQKEPR